MPNTRLRSSAHESLHRRIGRGHSNWTSELCGAGGSRGSEHPACPVVGASPQSRRRGWPRGRLLRGRATARSGRALTLIEWPQPARWLRSRLRAGGAGSKECDLRHGGVPLGSFGGGASCVASARVDAVDSIT